MHSFDVSNGSVPVRCVVGTESTEFVVISRLLSFSDGDIEDMMRYNTNNVNATVNKITDFFFHWVPSPLSDNRELISDCEGFEARLVLSECMCDCDKIVTIVQGWQLKRQ